MKLTVTSEIEVKVVSFSIRTIDYTKKKYWLHNKSDQSQLIIDLLINLFLTDVILWLL